MLKYSKIIDEETKMCDVGIGTDIDFYKSLGFIEREVEQSYNGNWFLKNYAPQKPLEQQQEKRLQELKLKRDEHLINNNYDFSENDKFNIINLIGYNEEEKNKYLEFIKKLKTQYDEYKEVIDKANSVEELDEINMEFREG